MRSIKRALGWLARLWQKHSERVLMTVEDEVLADELVDDQVLFGKLGPVRCGAIESAEYFRAYLGSNL